MEDLGPGAALARHAGSGGVDIDTLEKLSRYSPDIIEKCNIKELN